MPARAREVRHAETLALVRQLDYTPYTTRGSGADDWTDLGDRMNYVVDFFRSRQQEAELLEAPFTAEQVSAIHEGRLPSGRLWQSSRRTG